MAERPLTEHIRPGENPPDLAAYERLGGYRALRKMLKDLDARGVQNVVKEAGLRGRGGAGFPTAAKWSFVPLGDGAPRPKYLVCNADEMEPGTFKDRVLLEGNPHQLIEGMLIAAYAIDADHAYIFLRWEYRLAAKRLEKAIDEAYAAGYLGPRVLDSGYGLELGLHISGGRYICGEETALLNALEGKRATPRAKPPFPQVSGLFGMPTIVQNVETLCNLPHIINNGAAWYKALSRCEDGGTKLFGVSGKVKNPLCIELPMGTPMREIIEQHAGGMRDGFQLKGWLPGGASTDFLLPEHLDLPMDFASIQKAGSRLGTGTAIVLDDKTCPIGMVLSLERFFARESCGWCTPCRDGLPWVEKILKTFEEGGAVTSDIDVLAKHCKWLGPGNTFCALAPGAVEPLQSALKYYRDEFERHIAAGRCPYQEAA
jgi:NADH-quinone oxidoreductase subunit F